MAEKNYIATRLPHHLGVSIWNELLSPEAAHPELAKTVQADYLVIGGGFAGLSAARRLTQLNPGERIMLIEASGIGAAASGRNSGFMIDLPHDISSTHYAGEGTHSDTTMIRLNRQAIAFGRSAVEEYGVEPNFFDPAGKINATCTTAGARNNAVYAQHLRRMNEPHEVLDAGDMLRITGSHYYTSGIFTPGTVMLQPAGYVRGLVRGLRPKMAVYENTPAVQIRRQDDVWCVVTPKGKIYAKKVILANNGHLESFGIKRRQLMHIFLYGSITHELSKADVVKLGGLPRWGVTPSDPMGTTVRRIDTGQGGNRIITRTCADYRHDMVPTQKNLARARSTIRKKFDARFPQLRHVDMEHTWAGHLCLSQNGVSVTQEIEPGLYTACCQNGLGTTRGTLTGIAVAEMASGVTSEISTYFAKEDEPEKLPPNALSHIGANTYLRWKEWQARHE